MVLVGEFPEVSTTVAPQLIDIPHFHFDATQWLMKMDPTAVAALKAFVGKVKDDPATLHAPELEFLRDWLKELGATVPEPPTSTTDVPPTAAAAEPEEESEDEPMEEIPEPELDTSCKCLQVIYNKDCDHDRRHRGERQRTSDG